MLIHHSGKRKWVITAVVSLLDACDPRWRITRDGLIGSAFGASIGAYTFAALAVWAHVYYHISKEQVVSSDWNGKTYFLVTLSPFAENIKNFEYREKCTVFVVLLIAIFLTIIGIGLWVASAVLIYSKSTSQELQRYQRVGRLYVGMVLTHNICNT